METHNFGLDIDEMGAWDGIEGFDLTVDKMGLRQSQTRREFTTPRPALGVRYPLFWNRAN